MWSTIQSRQRSHNFLKISQEKKHHHKHNLIRAEKNYRNDRMALRKIDSQMALHKIQPHTYRNHWWTSRRNHPSDGA
jgi:hypothetical protein